MRGTGTNPFTYICLCLCAIGPLFFPSLVNAHPILADDPSNKEWHSPDESGEAVFIGDPKTHAPIIVLKKDAIAGLTVSIETDAKVCGISSGSTQLSIPITSGNGQVVKLALDAAPAKAVMRLDSKDQTALRGKWIQICLNKEKAVMLTFNNATFVNLKLEAAGQAAVNPLAIAPPALTPQAISGAAPQSSDLLDRIRPAVFLIKTFDEKRKLQATGTGFVVRSDGYALTNFHVVQGASSAAAVFSDNTDEVEIELVALRPELDMALIHVKRQGLVALQIQRAVPRQGTEVWTLGYPLDLGYSVNRGVVSGIRKFSEMPEDIQRGLKDYDKNSTWIQTDSTINHGNSGGPLVDNTGSVLGINTLTFAAKASNVFFAVQATQADNLMASMGKPTMTFAEAREKYKTTNTSWGVLPNDYPEIEIPETSTAAQVRTAATAVSNGILRNCTSCGGKGFVIVQVQVGSRQTGPMSIPVMEDRHQDCNACRGSGKERAPDAAADRLVKNLLGVLAAAKKDDPKLQEQLQVAYAAIRDSVAGDDTVLNQLTATSRGILAQKTIQPRTQIIGRATYMFTLPGPKSGERLHVAVMEDSTQIVILRNPVLADEIEKQTALISGLVAGMATSRDDRRIVVLQNGIVVRVPDRVIGSRRGGSVARPR